MAEDSPICRIRKFFRIIRSRIYLTKRGGSANWEQGRRIGYEGGAPQRGARGVGRSHDSAAPTVSFSRSAPFLSFCVRPGSNTQVPQKRGKNQCTNITNVLWRFFISLRGGEKGVKHKEKVPYVYEGDTSYLLLLFFFGFEGQFFNFF